MKSLGLGKIDWVVYRRAMVSFLLVASSLHLALTLVPTLGNPNPNPSRTLSLVLTLTLILA